MEKVFDVCTTAHDSRGIVIIDSAELEYLTEEELHDRVMEKTAQGYSRQIIVSTGSIIVFTYDENMTVYESMTVMVA